MMHSIKAEPLKFNSKTDFFTPVMLLIAATLVMVTVGQSAAQLKIAKLKYGGGGDWYANKTALPNLIKFCNEQLSSNIAIDEDVVE